MQNKKAYTFLIGSFLFFAAALSASGYVGNGNMDGKTLVKKINEARTVAGLPVLAVDAKLQEAARQKAEDMIARGYFSHTTPEGKLPWKLINANGYTFITAGENLAINYTEPEALLNAWLASDTHRDNILNPTFTDTGLSITTASTPTGPKTIIVQFFARPQ